jgi:prepilin-type N-terminal cleavage/methylation domain-containing protein
MMARYVGGIKGFTLIELLIVVGIISILVAISIPFYGQYHRRTQNTAAVSDLKNFRMQMEAEFADQHQYPSY